MKTLFIAVLGALLLCPFSMTGCDLAQPLNPEQETPDAAQNIQPEMEPDNVPADNVPADNVPADNVPADNVPADNVPADNVPADNAPADNAPADNALLPDTTVPADENVTTTKADASVGTRGRNFGTYTGNNPVEIITVPVATLFRVQDRITFMNLDRAMREFRALNDDRLPANQAEFDEKIIRPYGIKLPPLRPNQRYIYDPRDGELKVQTPKDAL